MRRLIGLCLVLAVVAFAGPVATSRTGSWLGADTRTARVAPEGAQHVPTTDGWLSYDNGSGYWVFPVGSDFWLGVGFDAGEGTLDTVLTFVLNWDDVSQNNYRFKFVVYDDNAGEPGAETWRSPEWHDVRFEAPYLDTVVVEAVAPPTGLAVTGKYYVFVMAEDLWPTELYQFLDDDGRQSPAGTQWGYDGEEFFQIGWSNPADMIIRSFHTPAGDDLGMTGFERPVYFGEMPMTFKPKSEIKNWGSNTQSDFDVNCEISTATDGVVYTQTVKITEPLASGESRSVEFPDWTNPPVGEYAVTFTSLLEDDNPDNDEITHDFPVATTLECYWDAVDPATSNGIHMNNSENAFLVAFPNYWGDIQITATKAALHPTFPSPGGDQYIAFIMDNTGTGGIPGAELYSSGALTGIRGAWNTNTLATPLDYSGARWYIGWQQVGDPPACPALCCQAPGQAPSYGPWVRIDDEFTNSNFGYGDWGIRCAITKTEQMPEWPEGWEEMASPVTTKPINAGGWLAVGPDKTDGEVIYAGMGNKTTGFAKYDPTDGEKGKWTALGPLPDQFEGKTKPSSKGSRGIVGGDAIYYLHGNGTLGFWKYNIQTGTWEALDNVPLGSYKKKVKGGEDMAYVPGNGDTGYVYLLKGQRTEFYRFNTVTKKWDETLQEVPYGGGKQKYGPGSFLVYDGDKTIYAHQAKMHDGTNHYLFAYDLIAKTWTQAPMKGIPVVAKEGDKDKKKKSADGAAGAWVNDMLYATKGGNTRSIFKCDPGTQTWTALENIPEMGTTAKKKRIKAGGDMVTYASGFFVLKGSKCNELWRYVEPAGPTQAQGQVGNVQAWFSVSPNPIASGFATLRYSLPQAGPAIVTVFDVAGRSVLRTAYNAERGAASASLDLRSLSAGVYLVRLDADGFSQTQRVVVQR